MTRSDTMRAPAVWRGLPFAVPSIVLSVLVGFVQVIGTIGAADHQPDRVGLDAWAIVLLLAGPAALLVRRSAPVPVFAFVAAVTAVYLGVGYPFGPVFLSLVIATFGAVVHGPRAAAWIIAATAFAGFLALDALVDQGGDLTGWKALGVAAWFIVVLTVAEVARATRERAREAAHAEQEHARREASDERVRIAREVHDVLAHSISLINVQAGVALHLLEERPEQVAPALAAIKETSREALGELGSVLAALRQDDDGVPLAPTPRLVRLPELVERSTTPDLQITLEVEGAARVLPAAVDLAVYRIAQEAITNVRRHANARNVVVHVTYRASEVEIVVDDDGRGGEVPRGGGTGVAGMRERVVALDGVFEAGSRPRGFQVRAVIPIVDAS